MCVVKAGTTVPGTKYLAGPHSYVLQKITTGIPCWPLSSAAAQLPRLGLIERASHEETHFIAIKTIFQNSS